MKKIIKSHIFIVLVVLVFNILFISSASACSFMYQTPQEVFDTSSIVFVGKIKKTTHDGDLNGTRTITFEVLKKYKGDMGTEVTMTTGANSAMCGFDEGRLSVGDIWSIHSQNTKSFVSLPANTQYGSLAEAQKDLDQFVDEKPTVCPMIYQPICGQKDTGIRCITTPCDSFETKTYSNLCVLNVEEAEYLYDGECKPDKPVVVIDPPAPTTDTPEEVESPTATSTDTPVVVDNQKENIIKRIWNFFMSLFR